MQTIIEMEKLSKLIGDDAITWYDPLNAAANKYKINTAKRAAYWFAQICIESGYFKQLEENLNYSEDGLLNTFPTHFTQKSAISYAHRPEKIADWVYANRLGNGDEFSGDGYKYRGRGLIQLTGKSNYEQVSSAIGHDFVNNPSDLAIPDYAALSAGWFWYKHGCNELADQNSIVRISQLINGGNNLIENRVALSDKVFKIMEA